MIEFAQKQVAVAGFGVEGQATAKFLQTRGAIVTVLDENTQLDQAGPYTFKVGKQAFSDLESYDFVFRTAGLHPRKLSVDQSKILTAYSLLLQDYRQQVIGVTGTKGKGTTSTLIGHILKAAGKDVYVAGNIGHSPLDFYDQLTADSLIVMELSSFQLIDAQQSPHAAVMLMIEPDHMDWHSNMDEYIDSKLNLVRFQSDLDIAVYNPENPNTKDISQEFEWALPYLRGTQGHVRNGYICFAENKITPVSEVGLIGPHNLENICAATTVCWYILKEQGLDEKQIITALNAAIRSFSGLPHRNEDLGEVNGVRYINDTFSANPIALQAALSSFEQPKIPIVGGFDKKVGQENIIKALIKYTDSIRHVVLIGQTAEAIAELLQHAGFSNYSILPLNTNMKTIVAMANSHAEPGDVVLLSPGHASFDMFKNYKDRGEQFKQAVAELSNE
ncbi:TPA: UDP-N-acetylmuramoyl-L-alanine--D-glutamate ligase [Candidatus Saccharibacteria bacterium]|nr:UDP-N-acetylmuramoyl-L-alanine--D-glutamate ligase [Candidatus Saccharibacteria bacterium]HIO87237.1 UDP-N-acetylmuramoyl-L-alanine--D-glutamate ligase [Candidatus Saccharibacteria bacterium]